MSRNNKLISNDLFSGTWNTKSSSLTSSCSLGEVLWRLAAAPEDTAREAARWRLWSLSVSATSSLGLGGSGGWRPSDPDPAPDTERPEPKLRDWRRDDLSAVPEKKVGIWNFIVSHSHMSSVRSMLFLISSKWNCQILIISKRAS